MKLDAQSARKTSFGQFEVDMQTGELFKNGKRVRLSGQSARLLVILVQRAGQLVSREDLRLNLWPQDTYVDFDRGLNNCISRIREALADPVESPRCIETLPKQGYRFISEVHASGQAQTIKNAVLELPEKQDSGSSASGLSPHSPQGKRHWAAVVSAGLVVLVCLGAVWRLWQRDYFWHNPLDSAKVERLTDFDGDEFDAAISPDGKFAIFSSDRSGQPDVWLTQIGSGEFANITKGSVPGLIFNNGTLRALGFSGDGSQVWSSKWVRELPGKGRTWIGPSIGGVFRVLLEVGMEPVWSPDGERMVFHTPEAGDPIYLADRSGNNPKRLFVDKPGVHCHFLTWSPDGRFVYFVKGTPTTEETDVWRIPALNTSIASVPERITYHNARVAYLSWLDSRTLVYSATAAEGSGQWLYSMDVEHRIPHRISSGLEDQYLTVSVSDKNPRRLVASVGRPSATLWTIPISDQVQGEASAARFPVPNARALGPRLGSGYVLFLSGRGGGDGLWRLDSGTARELWKGSDGGLVAPAAIAPDDGQICFTYKNEGRASLHIMSANGTNVRALAPSLDVRGGASWSPDGKWLAVAADRGDGTHLFKVPVDGGEPVQLLDTLSYNPVWSPDGKVIIYSGQQAGGEFVVKAITPDKSAVPLPVVPVISVIYVKGTPYRFLPGENALIVLEGDFRKQDFFRVDLSTREQRKLTDMLPGFRVESFDVTPDGKQIVFDRLRDNADIVVMDLPK